LRQLQPQHRAMVVANSRVEGFDQLGHFRELGGETGTSPAWLYDLLKPQTWRLLCKTDPIRKLN
jgi:hypothetical protein